MTSSPLFITALNPISIASEPPTVTITSEFESYFTEQVFNAMIETTTVFSDDDEDGYASKMVDYFKDFAVQELCDQVTDGEGIGIANTLYEQMKRNYGIDTIQPKSDSEE